MRDEGSDVTASVPNSRAVKVLAALVGFLAAAGCFTIFFLLVSSQAAYPDMVVFDFVAGVFGAGLGLTFVYRLIPTREPESLFAGSVSMVVQEPPPIAAEQRNRPKEPAPPALASPGRTGASPGRPGNQSKKLLPSTLHDSGGTASLLVLIALCLGLPSRVDIGWAFLSLGLCAGCAVALVLCWINRWQQKSDVTRYTIRVGGGAVGALSLIGLAIVMARFGFLRYFLGLAVAAGGVIAFALNRMRSRKETSRGVIA